MDIDSDNGCDHLASDLANDARMEALWDTNKTAEFLSMTAAALRQMVCKRAIPEGCIIRIGRRVRFVPSKVRKWLGLGGSMQPPVLPTWDRL